MNKEDRQKMIAAMRVISEICIKCDCTECPLYDNCGDYDRNYNYTPALWILNRILEEEEEK